MTRLRKPSLFVVAALAAGTASAADLLPLKHGIYVPAGRPCRGASNAEMVNYWGGKSAIGRAQAVCTIRKLGRKGPNFTIHDACRDIQNNGITQGGPIVLKISSPKSFEMSGTRYTYCGPKVQW